MKIDFEIIKATYEALDSKFGQDIVVLDISNISSMADYFVIATASNPTQIKAMIRETEKNLIDNKVVLNHLEQSDKWALLDFGDIIVHIFDKENREFYNLERIWGDAIVVPNEKFVQVKVVGK